MKKLFIITLFLCLFINTPLSISANSTIITGYTNDGIFYEAITLNQSSFIEPLAPAKSISVTKQFTYDGIITPAVSLEWREIIDGTAYVGTLHISSLTHTSTNTTIVIYQGTLYQEYNIASLFS